MNKEIRAIILDGLKKAIKSIEEGDIKTLKELSNYTIHSASTSQDEDSITFTVLMYALFKVYERKDYREMESWNLFDKNAKSYLRAAYNSLNKKDTEGYRKDIREFLKSIDKLDNKLKNYIQQVIESSKISKGSRLYEHGVSLGRTAELLGVNAFELMDYIGETGISDIMSETVDVKKRLAKARGLFK